MSVAAAIRAVLLADGTVTGLLASTSRRSGIYPVTIPQDARLPAIRTIEVTSDHKHTHDGPMELAESFFELDCYAEDYDASRTLADAVRGALNGYSGTAAGMKIQWCRLDSIDDLEETGRTGQPGRIYRALMRFRVFHNGG